MATSLEGTCLLLSRERGMLKNKPFQQLLQSNCPFSSLYHIPPPPHTEHTPCEYSGGYIAKEPLLTFNLLFSNLVFVIPDLMSVLYYPKWAGYQAPELLFPHFKVYRFQEIIQWPKCGLFLCCLCFNRS